MKESYTVIFAKRITIYVDAEGEEDAKEKALEELQKPECKVKEFTKEDICYLQ